MNTHTVQIARPSHREGDWSPKISTAVLAKRTQEAKIHRKKTIGRDKRRRYKRTGIKGLEKLLARFQKQRETTSISSE